MTAPSGQTPRNSGDDTVQPLRFWSLLPWHLLILLAISFQYLLSWQLTPEDMVFTGALQNPDDLGVYVSAMRQGAAGEWLYHFTYSPETWKPRLMLLPYLALGKITAIFARPDVLWLHIWRIVLSGLSLGLILFWVKTALPSVARWRWTAWFLIWFGAGIGWFLALFWPSTADWVPDIGMAEWSPIASLFNTPHFALGLGLEALTFACLLKALQGDSRRWRWSLAGSLAALLASLTYVYHLATIPAALGLYLLAAAVRERKVPWRLWAQGALILLPLLPLLAYYILYTGDDPYWIHYTRFEHVIPPPTPVATLIGLGGLAPLAVAGGWRWIRQGRNLLLPAWIVANLLLLYLPFVAFSGRFALGLLIPVATLAAVGLESVLLPFIVTSKAWPSLARLSATPQATLRRIVLILLMPSVLMNLLLFMKGPRIQPDFPYYLPAADVAAARWLGQNSDDSAVTLAYYPLGNYLPRVYSGKVFLGHLHFTSWLSTKLDLFDQFWRDSMSAAETEAFLEHWGITHIFLGSYEKKRIDEVVRPPGKAVYDLNGVTIYEVSTSTGSSPG